MNFDGDPVVATVCEVSGEGEVAGVVEVFNEAVSQIVGLANVQIA